MEFEWDEEKRLRVLAERGIDLRAMTALFDGRIAYPTCLYATTKSDG